MGELKSEAAVELVLALEVGLADGSGEITDGVNHSGDAVTGLRVPVLQVAACSRDPARARSTLPR